MCVFYVWVAEWPPPGKMAANSAYYMFSEYKYLIVNLVNLVFTHLEFWSGNFFLIAKFPHCCLLLLFTYGVNTLFMVL